MDDYLDYLQDALELVSTWEVPEEQFFGTVREQALVMAGMPVDWTGEIPAPTYRTTLRF